MLTIVQNIQTPAVQFSGVFDNLAEHTVFQMHGNMRKQGERKAKACKCTAWECKLGTCHATTYRRKKSSGTQEHTTVKRLDL